MMSRETWVTVLLISVIYAPPAHSWSDRVTHPSQTDQALRLVEATDSDGRYHEVYHFHWWTESSAFSSRDFYNPRIESGIPGENDHPSVIGTYSEDYYGREGLIPTGGATDAVATFVFDKIAFGTLHRQRDFNHFGVEPPDSGLEWNRSFIIRSRAQHPDDRFRRFPDCTPLSDGHFVAANVWALGGGDCQNRNGFEDAIDVYRHYTLEAVRESYRRLGHALHLLQDVGQPDHARLIPHPCSDREADEELDCLPFHSDDFVRESCEAGIMLTEPVGFEAFARRTWDSILSDVDVPSLNIPSGTIESLFTDMADDAKAIDADEFPDNKPLGCSNSFNPTIPTGFELITEREPFHNLAVDLNRSIIPRSARLIQFFYEIVNYPPYVTDIKLLQSDSTLYHATWDDIVEEAPELAYRKPVSFTRSGGPFNYMSHTVEEFTPEVVRGRELNVATDQRIVAGRTTQIEVKFGPTVVVPQRMESATARILGRTVILVEDDDRWIGSFDLSCDESIPTDRTPIHISAEDAEAHLQSRFRGGSPTGRVLDADPSTLAFAVDTDQWSGYEPGDAEFLFQVQNTNVSGISGRTRIFARSGRPVIGDAANVVLGIEDADLSESVNQLIEVSAWIETDGGTFPASRYEVCADIEFEVGSTATFEDGNTVSLGDVGLRLASVDEGTVVSIMPFASSDTPLGRYDNIPVIIRDRRSGFEQTVFVSVIVRDAPEFVNDIRAVWINTMGLDPSDFRRQPRFREWFERVNSLIFGSESKPDCPMGPQTLCWYSSSSNWEATRSWFADRRNIERIHVWLTDDSVTMPPDQAAHLDRVAQLKVIADERTTLVFNLLEGRLDENQAIALHNVTVSDLERWRSTYFENNRPIEALRSDLEIDGLVIRDAPIDRNTFIVPLNQ